MIRILNKKAPLGPSILTGRILSPWDEMFLKKVESYGGFDNAHGHLCRADTIGEEYLSHIHVSPLEAASLPLQVKQNMTGNLHEGLAYTEANLRTRMSGVIERLIRYGTRRFCTCIDVTPDIGEGGLLAWRIAQELKQKYADRIAIELGPAPIFGFKAGTDRFKVFAEAAKTADFISALPEKDDYAGMRDRDGKIGYREHICLANQLACEFGIPLQIHIDQANSPYENGTEILMEGLKGWMKQPQLKQSKTDGYNKPSIWLIHMLSPSCYSEERFARLSDLLVEFNIGLNVCPTATLSNRQLRPIMAPIHNSTPRVLELCKIGIIILVGSDNICDLFVSSSDGDMLTEMKVLSHNVRFPIPHVLAKLAAGVMLNEVDRATIGEFLYQDRKVFTQIDPNWTPAVQ